MNSSEFMAKAKELCTAKTMYIQTALGAPLTKANKLRLASATPFNSQRSKKIFDASEDTIAFDEIGLISYISGVKFKDYGQLMSQCFDISKDLSTVAPGEIVFMRDRAGIFIGDGKVVTVSLEGVGMTTIEGWVSHGKLAYVTYVDPEVEEVVAEEAVVEAEPDDLASAEEEVDAKSERNVDIRHDSRRRRH